ncbi:hypothetical protein BDV27DRAFT_119387 [Aspergillus caelatus]|uniref:Uncharacterized protein n=1 Tax=Aspergillus caelatus TaxID=61420 RepID=A0A5N7ALP8_9EURO|nr:uncharacterized protein BDV27DRAFT_119387 [Aspergillus caelatus]KAE8370745.1 hypothetical protein BDV27DRAFT_119387 [Aspergillus caelatus]
MAFAASGSRASAWITTSVFVLCFIFPRALIPASIAAVIVLPSFVTLSLIAIILSRRLFVWLTTSVFNLLLWYKCHIQTRWIGILFTVGLLAALLAGLLSSEIQHGLSQLHVSTSLALIWVVMCWIVFRSDKHQPPQIICNEPLVCSLDAE